MQKNFLSLDKTESSLAKAVHRYVNLLRQQEKDNASIFELYKVLVRLGFDCQEVLRLPERGTASLSQELRIAARAAIEIQLQAMGRQVRQGGHQYDINAHIALKRAQAMLDAKPAEKAAEPRFSGSQLNARFKRAGRVRHRENQH
ncbi:hypothetical protein FPY71_11685 [Aureimonas fodinaquatilis]|uniref:Uncharacterized protein n=1 Tax=Aureimonas fodinaquatilis TaxID=2565783 RepID=A0A5B0E0V5_9HYPH|nr:hypothetical protein [Aureimonas fodinaquatilis]KAA0971099.1 hypothetical protein FPY71_11685 [Aureimonas fodinaquatilis]